MDATNDLYNSTSLSMENPSKSLAELRIELDLKEIKDNYGNSLIIFADKIDENFRHIEAAILAPQLTPYQNSIILLNIKLSDQFPFLPPQSIVIKRPIMHPNIDEWGNFLSDILSPSLWTPVMTLKNILEHVEARLIIPDIDSDYCDPVRAQAYRTDPENFNRLAREYAVKYCGAV